MSLQTRVSSYLDRKQNAWNHTYWPIPFHHGTHQSKQEGTKYDHSKCHEFYENKKSKCKHLSDGVQKNWFKDCTNERFRFTAAFALSSHCYGLMLLMKSSNQRLPSDQRLFVTYCTNCQIYRWRISMITLYNKSNFPFPSPKISRILQLRWTLHGKDNR